MSKVFVSYVRRDTAVVGQIVEDIRNAGHEVFLDQGITGGQQWWDTILDQIEQSSVFMPVLSSAYLSSEPCRREAQWAEALGIPVVPLDVGPSSPAQFPEWIAKAQWIRYDIHDRRTLGLIYQAISRAGPVRSPVTAPERPAIPISYLDRLGFELRGDQDIPRSRQIVILNDLQRRLGDPTGDADARELLSVLASRPEVTADVHRQIGELLDRDAPGRLRSLLSDPKKRRSPASASAQSAGFVPQQQSAPPPQHSAPPPQHSAPPPQHSAPPPQPGPPWAPPPQFGAAPGSAGWSGPLGQRAGAALKPAKPGRTWFRVGIAVIAFAVVLGIIGLADRQDNGYSGSQPNAAVLLLALWALVIGIVLLSLGARAKRRARGIR